VCLLPFKSGAFLAGAPVQPVILRYGEDRVSPAWDSINALWHSVLMLANPFHSVTARQVSLLKIPSLPPLHAVGACTLQCDPLHVQEALMLSSKFAS